MASRSHLHPANTATAQFGEAVGAHPEIFIGGVPFGTTAKELQHELDSFAIKVDTCVIKNGSGGCDFAFARLCSATDLRWALDCSDLI